MQLYRTMLFIPAQKDRWIAKAGGLGITITAKHNATRGGDGFADVGYLNATGIGLGADSIILDLEDALPDDLKAPTRARIGAAIDAVASAGVPCFVRTNAMATGMLFEDLDAVATPALTGIVLAKVDTPEEVRTIDTFLSDLERRRGIHPPAGRIMVGHEAGEQRSTARRDPVELHGELHPRPLPGRQLGPHSWNGPRAHELDESPASAMIPGNCGS